MEPKHVRFAVFIERLRSAPPAGTRDEALQQITEILLAVEDEFTDIPFNPDAWETDGRMYPPRRDSERTVEGRPQLRRYRSRAHNTFIGNNGAIEIRDARSGAAIFSKSGANGQFICDI